MSYSILFYLTHHVDGKFDTPTASASSFKYITIAINNILSGLKQKQFQVMVLILLLSLSMI